MPSGVCDRILPLTAAWATPVGHVTSLTAPSSAGLGSLCGRQRRWVDSMNFTASVCLQFSEVILCGESAFHRSSTSGNSRHSIRSPLRLFSGWILTSSSALTSILLDFSPPQHRFSAFPVSSPPLARRQPPSSCVRLLSAGEGAPPAGGASPGSCFESLSWAEQLRQSLAWAVIAGGGCCPVVSFVWFSYITKREERPPSSPLSSCSSCLNIWGESAGFPGFSLDNPNCNQYFPLQFVRLFRPFPSRSSRSARLSDSE